MTGIAIVGGGAAGIGAAYRLAQVGFGVSLFEADDHLGGHCFGVPVPTPAGEVLVDAGVSDFNPHNFTNVKALFEDLDLPYHPVGQDASFMTPDREAVWYIRDGEQTFLESADAPAELGAEIQRFNQSSVEVLDDVTFSDWTIEKYLDDRGYSQGFRRLFLYPRAAGCFPMPDRRPENYMIRTIVSFWKINGIVGPGPAPQMVLDAGMHSYPNAFGRWLEEHDGKVYCGHHIVGIARRSGGIRLRAVDDQGANLEMEFDHAIFATNANEVIPTLEDATVRERRIFDGFQWQRARRVVHGDDRLMPFNRDSWGAYNYLIDDQDEVEIRPTITFYANLLAGLPGEAPDAFVTMNPYVEPAEDSIYFNKFFVHPVAGASSDTARDRLHEIQGEHGTWFCGAYLREPFVHEDALTSGIETAELLIESLRGGGRQQPSDERDFDDFLAEVPLLTGLDTSALADVQLAARPFSAAAGEVIVHRGEDAKGVYLIKEGRVAIDLRAPGDDNVRLVELGHGGLFGGLSLLAESRRTTTATAEEPTSGYFISRQRAEMLQADLRPGALEILTRALGAVVERIRTEAAELCPDDEPPTTDAPAQPVSWPEEFSCEVADLDPAQLAALPVFAELNREELEALLGWCHRWDLPRGQILYRQGERAESLAIVVRGAVELSRHVAGEKKQIAVVGPGRGAGFLALIDGLTRPFTYTACEATILLRLDRARFEMLRHQPKPLAFKLFRPLGRGAARVLQQLDQHKARVASVAAFRAGTDAGCG
jgi:predicted NAD/FAD-binding protein/CRP-like cAMP-binding protein